MRLLRRWQRRHRPGYDMVVDGVELEQLLPFPITGPPRRRRDRLRSQPRSNHRLRRAKPRSARRRHLGTLALRRRSKSRRNAPPQLEPAPAVQPKQCSPVWIWRCSTAAGSISQRLQRALAVAPLHLEHLVEVAVEDFAAPAHVDRVAAHEAIHGRGIEGVVQEQPCNRRACRCSSTRKRNARSAGS